MRKSFLVAAVLILASASPAFAIEPIQDGNYQLGACSVHIDHAGKDSKASIGLVGKQSEAFVQIDEKTGKASCVFFQVHRYDGASVKITESPNQSQVTIHCGGAFSAIDGTVSLVFDKAGKLIGARQDLKYAKYGSSFASFPFIKDQGDALVCEGKEQGDLTAPAVHLSSGALHVIKGESPSFPESSVTNHGTKSAVDAAQTNRHQGESAGAAN